MLETTKFVLPTPQGGAADALLKAGLIRKLGGGWTTRYSPPAPR